MLMKTFSTVTTIEKEGKEDDRREVRRRKTGKRIILLTHTHLMLQGSAYWAPAVLILRIVTALRPTKSTHGLFVSLRLHP